jgi:hypothetical protein
MQAKTIAVEAWNGNESAFIDVYKGFGDSFAGLVVNKVPKSQLAAASEAVKEQLKRPASSFSGSYRRTGVYWP